jgi:hypothetical protein
MPEHERDHLEEIWQGPLVHPLHRNVWTYVQTKGSRHMAEFIWVSRGRRVEVVARARLRALLPART